MKGANIDWSMLAGAPYENKAVYGVGEEGDDPFDQVLWCVVFVNTVGQDLPDNVIESDIHGYEAGGAFQ